MATQQIDIAQLPIEQLNQLAKQLDQEIELFSSSMNQLKHAQNKFVESQESLNKISPESLSKDILVPLTGSIYVPGQLSDVQNVMVDIGTGYYVDMVSLCISCTKCNGVYRDRILCRYGC
ncbi:Hypothetical predicted protein [Mytilus galloprovincialis]|uniref:Prefoldin subunit 5 n=1 Tax=Mytilus galloprovincialis TaxID=29158 RepID=A0A8B6E382_MYTGA|nr:Hypothetical predicted protein [Mytilus galloprovincialis]